MAGAVTRLGQPHAGGGINISKPQACPCWASTCRHLPPQSLARNHQLLDPNWGGQHGWLPGTLHNRVPGCTDGQSPTLRGRLVA